MPQSNKQEKGLWARGVVLSFDFVTQDLRDDFSNSSQFQDEDWKKERQSQTPPPCTRRRC